MALWYEPSSFAVLDHQQQKLWLAASSPEALDDLDKRLFAVGEAVWGYPIPAEPTPLTLEMTQQQYEAAVIQAKQHIQAGDVFQVNLSLRVYHPNPGPQLAALPQAAPH